MARITIGGDPINTSGELPNNGTQLSNYAFAKNDLSSIELSEFTGKRVVLNIFPSIDTSVCATSVRTFNERVSALENTVVLSVSKDLPFALTRFCGAEGIENVITTSDFKTPDFAKDNGLLLIDGPFEGLNARTIIVLDEDRKVIYSELVPEIAQEPDYEAAVAVL